MKCALSHRRTPRADDAGRASTSGPARPYRCSLGHSSAVSNLIYVTVDRRPQARAGMSAAAASRLSGARRECAPVDGSQRRASRNGDARHPRPVPELAFGTPRNAAPAIDRLSEQRNAIPPMPGCSTPIRTLCCTSAVTISRTPLDRSGGYTSADEVPLRGRPIPRSPARGASARDPSG